MKCGPRRAQHARAGRRSVRFQRCLQRVALAKRIDAEHLAILHQQVWLVLGLQFVITLTGVGILHGLAPILTSESFPTQYRYSGAGISYSLSAILGGGIAPPLLAGLIGQDVAGNWFYIPVVYGIYAVIAVAALALTPETRNRRLDDVIDAGQAQAGSGGKVACGAPT